MITNYIIFISVYVCIVVMVYVGVALQPTTTQQYNKSITHIYTYLFNYVNLNPLQTYSVCVVVKTIFIFYYSLTGSCKLELLN